MILISLFRTTYWMFLLVLTFLEKRSIVSGWILFLPLFTTSLVFRLLLEYSLPGDSNFNLGWGKLSIDYLGSFRSTRVQVYDGMTTCWPSTLLLTNHRIADQSNVMSLVEKTVDCRNFVYCCTLVCWYYERNLDGLGFRILAIHQACHLSLPPGSSYDFQSSKNKKSITENQFIINIRFIWLQTTDNF